MVCVPLLESVVDLVCGSGRLIVEGVIVRVCGRVYDEGCEVCVVMDVEYGDRVVERVWKDVVLAGISDGVLPHR